MAHLAARSEAARAGNWPELAVADGALGFWKALGEVWPKTREQRCWVHKTANVLNRLPKSQHVKAKRALQVIWMAETKTDADAAFDAFIESYEVKYDKAADDVGRQPLLVVTALRRLALCRAVLAERRTGATLGYAKLTTNMLDAGTAARRAQ